LENAGIELKRPKIELFVIWPAAGAEKIGVFLLKTKVPWF